jgi:hypothetical protein
MRYTCRILIALCSSWMSLGVAYAACTVSPPISTTISPTAINLGTLASPVSITATVTVTFPVSGKGNCSTSAIVHLSGSGPGGAFQMVRFGGTEVLAYTVSPNDVSPAFANPSTTNSQTTISASFTTTIALAGGQSGPNGTYNGTLTAQALLGGTPYGSPGSALVSLVVGNPTSCTIGGLSNGGTQTVDFSNGKTISTAQKFAVFGSVTCNAPATIALTSSGGAAKSGSAASTSHDNFFDYTASTTVNGATVTLNTSSNPARTGPETASASITAATTTNAPLSIAVQPIAPPKPLVAGSYSDVMTVTITPN